LVQDAAELIESLGAGPAAVVGHDWGGIVAWLLVMRRPDLVRGVAVLNAPHPATFHLALRHPSQLLKSWYAFLFQLPWFPEAALTFQDFGIVRHVLRRQPTRAGAFSRGDIRLYRDALAVPGALTAALNYYRAAAWFRGDVRGLQPYHGPATVIWGERDAALTPHVLDGLVDWAPAVRIVRLPAASHWVQNDAPIEVNRALLDFLDGLEGNIPAAAGIGP